MSVFDHIQSLLEGQDAQPPIHLWHPQLSGDIDIIIRANGDWYHEGGLIQRPQLVKLFASILRRENDGDYYLVTPVEKWRLQVEDAPLLIIAMEVNALATQQQAVIFTSNTGRLYSLGEQYPLVVEYAEQGGEPAPYLELDNCLRAKLSRAVFYELVGLADSQGSELVVRSKQQTFTLGSVE